MSSDASSLSSGQFDAVMRRIDDLEETIEQQAERIDELELLLEIRSDGETAGMEDIWIAGQPIGLVAAKANARSKENKKELDAVEATATDGGSRLRDLDEQVRERMLPIHQMWVDVSDGNGDHLGKTDRRAAVLFGKFVRRAGGQSVPSVDPSYNTYSMDSTRASDVLVEFEGDETVGHAMSVRRAMEAVEQYSQVDGDAVIKFNKNKGTNTLAVDKDQFNAIMSNFESAITETGHAPTDDTSEQLVEDADDRIDEIS